MTTDTSSVRQDESVAVSKVRNIRVDDALWRLAGIVTRRRRETISGVIKRLLAEYVEQHATDDDRAAAHDQLANP
jgi:hypothetical protein